MNTQVSWVLITSLKYSPVYYSNGSYRFFSNGQGYSNLPPFGTISGLENKIAIFAKKNSRNSWITVTLSVGKRLYMFSWSSLERILLVSAPFHESVLPGPSIRMNDNERSINSNFSSIYPPILIFSPQKNMSLALLIRERR